MNYVRNTLNIPLCYTKHDISRPQIEKAMKTPSPASLTRHLRWTDAVAHSQRRAGRISDQPALIAVAAVSDQMLTTPTTALISIVLNATGRLPMVAVDADGVNQPLRGPLGAHRGGDLAGLTQLPSWGLQRSQIEPCADNTGATPLLTTANPQPLDPEELMTALHRASHRWPVVVVDLPYTCNGELIVAATSIATHVVLVADRYYTDTSWLARPGHHLSEPAQQGRVSVVRVGAQPSESDPAGMLTLPAARAASARDRIDIPTDPAAVIQYNRLVTRLFATR